MDRKILSYKFDNLQHLGYATFRVATKANIISHAFLNSTK
jgi:hypothetical protein